MTINHARSTIGLFISASGTEEIDTPGYASHKAAQVSTYTSATATKVYANAKSFTSTEVFTITLSSGLAGPVPGDAFGFSTISELWIRNTGATAITVSGNCTALNGCTIQPGGVAGIGSPSTPHTVTLATTDSLTLTNATGSGSAEILILGS